MAKLWDKGYNINHDIEDFTVGNDFILDKALLKWDIVGSIAHATMLAKIGILESNELKKLKTELTELLNDKTFQIKKEDEDVHTAVENYLTKKLGDLGKKLHTGRSRNDQVLLDTRLYSKDNLLKLQELVLDLCESLYKFAKNNNVVMPGYTHTQKAMPSSTGLWATAFLESFLDDITLLKTAYKLNDQSPLGSAAGYGVPMELDRKLVADILGFKKVQSNPLYCSNSRGKIESIILNALTHMMLDIGKLATDLIWFSTPEFGYFILPKEICTGSSIMPQKKNPDVLELLRAKVSIIQSYQFQIENIIKNQFSGYNRDYQLTKEPLIKGVDLALQSIKITKIVIDLLQVDREKCVRSCTKELFATEYALDMVKKGTPFRDAYKQVASNIENLETKLPKKHDISNYPQIKSLQLELGKEKSHFKNIINKNFKY